MQAVGECGHRVDSRGRGCPGDSVMRVLGAVWLMSCSARVMLRPWWDVVIVPSPWRTRMTRKQVAVLKSRGRRYELTDEGWGRIESLLPK